MSEQEIQANDLVQYVGPNADLYATYGRVHTVHTFGLPEPIAETLFADQTGMDAVPVKFLHKVPANPNPEVAPDHGPLAAHLSNRTLDKVLSRPAHVPRETPSLVEMDQRDEVRSLLAGAIWISTGGVGNLYDFGHTYAVDPFLAADAILARFEVKAVTS